MLDIHFVTIHPEFIRSYLSFGVFNSASQNQLVKTSVVNLRDFSLDKHGTVDGAPYGGGDGMIMRPEPLVEAIKTIESPHVILTSPRGKIWTQDTAIEYSSMKKPIVFICGRFGGVDQRFIDHHVDEQYSIGDVVLSGGELPSLVMSDSILRQIPGVLGHKDSARMDSFGDGCFGLLEHDLYTRPPEFQGKKVPAVLMSGDHKKIDSWRQNSSKKRTEELRPDLISFTDSNK